MKPIDEMSISEIRATIRDLEWAGLKNDPYLERLRAELVTREILTYQNI